MKLYLARHGGTDLSDEGRYQGSSDAALNHHGMTQARRLSQHLPADIQCIVSSPRLRALQTAYTVAQARGLRVEVVPELRERDHGAFEGLTPAEVAARYPALAPSGAVTAWDAAPPGGESVHQVLARVSGVLAGLPSRCAGQVVLVCAHACVIQAICHLLDGPEAPQHLGLPRPGNAEFIVRHWSAPLAVR